MYAVGVGIISYQAITGNNNPNILIFPVLKIISYQAITGNNNGCSLVACCRGIISYQAITGNNNVDTFGTSVV